jgi:hypothetical protein
MPEPNISIVLEKIDIAMKVIDEALEELERLQPSDE